jgi:6-pyruvoyltetrahydropterin/6-carboxytetrahydropterin synthase
MDHQLLAPGWSGILLFALIMASTLTRTVTFHALHRYYRPEWSEARNREAFGSLAESPGHGHDYRCGVTVRGTLDQSTGMLVDLGLLDRILRDEVLTHLAGKHLNLDVPAFAYGQMLPTCEAIAAYLFPRIAARLPAGVALERVRVAEDPTLYADCTGTT